MTWGRIHISSGFLLLVAWLLYCDDQGFVPLALLACAFHEGGHWLMIRLLGGGVRSIFLTVSGAAMTLNSELSYGGELLAAAAGPLMNLLLSAVVCRFPWGELFAGLNLALAALNLLPVFPLDGGRILHCALCMAVGEQAAGAICRGSGLLFAGGLLGLSLWSASRGGNLTLLLVALWVLLGGENREIWGKYGKRVVTTVGRG